MNYFVYILYSPAFKRTYASQTKDLSNRFTLHNTGRVRSTKPYKPWILIYSESYDSRAESMKREKWFKSKGGRKKITEILDDVLKSEGNSLGSGRL
jgi:putative endonuclease